MAKGDLAFGSPPQPPVGHSRQGARGRRRRFYPVCILLSILALFCVFPLQRHKIKSVVPPTDQKSARSYTLGFALSPTYGTVAAHDNRGVLLAEAKVDVDSSYLSMMERLSLESSRHLSPPYGPLGDLLADGPRQAIRKFWRRLGLPSTSDVGRLAKVVEQLRAAAEDQLLSTDFKPTDFAGAVFALPSIIALYPEDACDAFEYLGIDNLLGTQVAETQLRPMTAAYHGHGRGSCAHWRNRKACSKELEKLPYEMTLLVEYSRGYLSVHFSELVFVHQLDHFDSENVVVDFLAGSEHSSDPMHMQRIREHITSVVESSDEVDRYVTLVMLIGESAQDAEFQESVKAAVAPFGNPKILASNPLYLTANATSDIAWRSAEVRRMHPKKTYYPCPLPR